MGQAYSASTRSRILKGMLINVPKKQQYKKILQGLEILWVKTTDFKAQHSPPDPLTSWQVPYRCKSPLNLNP